MVLKLSDSKLEKIIEFRHSMHKYPELSDREFKTTEKIKKFISDIDGVEIINTSMKTGVLSKIKSGSSGKVIGLRCDIDAINQIEENELTYKSRNKGVMHACGHDFHTAALLGSMLLLSEVRESLKGDVVFLFQKAEETTTGAKQTIDMGLFDLTRTEMFFGLHNWPLVDSGKVILKKGALMSAKINFLIKIKGCGGHGSMPHLNIDPIVCSSNIIMSLQTIISRNINPLDSTVLSINSINGGSENNLVVEEVKMQGTIRALSKESMNKAIQRMETLVKDISSAYECEYNIEYIDKVPITFNSESMYKLAYETCLEVVGIENIVSTEPTMASEDFAFIMEKVPSFMYWFGSAEKGISKEPLHSRRFFASDKGIKTAAEVLANSVIKAQQLQY